MFWMSGKHPGSLRGLDLSTDILKPRRGHLQPVFELECEKGSRAMTNIVKFPGAKQAPPEPPIEAPKQATTPANDPALLKGIWVVTVLLWPFLKWIVALDCVYQLVRMMYYWNTPGVFGGFTFMLHFGVFVALTYFVSLYKPRGL